MTTILTRSIVLASALILLAFSSTASAARFAAPGGTLQIDSFGVTELESESDTPVPVLHVRMVASNQSDETGWTLDTRGVIATVVGEGSSRPAFANVDSGTPPLLAIPLGEQRTIDLYYPLASELQPGFTVTWQLQTGGGLWTSRSAFPAELPAAQVAALGHGAVWWYDPIYPRQGFRSRPVFRASPRHRIVVRPHLFARPAPRPGVELRLRNKGKPYPTYREPVAIPHPAPGYRAPHPAPGYRAPHPSPSYRGPGRAPTVNVRPAGSHGQGNHGGDGRDSDGRGGRGRRW